MPELSFLHRPTRFSATVPGCYVLYDSILTWNTILCVHCFNPFHTIASFLCTDLASVSTVVSQQDHPQTRWPSFSCFRNWKNR